MDRPIIYTQENIRGFDLAKGWQDALKATGKEAQGILGGTTTVAAGLAATETSPQSLSINIGTGSIFALAALDATAAGDLPVDGGSYFMQGINWATQQVTLSTSALAAGQSQWALVQATFGLVDVIRSGDPNAGVLPFYNSANPTVPLQGQGGSGSALNTERTAAVVFSVVYGTPATTGSEVPPSAAANNVGLYLIDLTYGQTTISTGQILTAGPSVGTGVPSNYPYAPFLAGLLNSHHNGNPGQAPKVNLATEVQGILPANNLQTSGSFTGTLGGGWATNPTGTFNWILQGSIVTLALPASEVNGIQQVATSASVLTLTGLPAALYPSVPRVVASPNLTNAGQEGVYSGIANVSNTGLITISLYVVSSSNIMNDGEFALSGSAGLGPGWSISYPL